MAPKAKFKQLKELFNDCRKKQIILFVLCSFSVISEILLMYQVQGLIDNVVDGSSRNVLLQNFLQIVMTGIFAFIATVVQTRMWHIFRHELINKMRIKMYKSMLNKASTFFDTTTTGDIVSGIVNDGSIVAENAGIEILMFWLNLMKIIIIRVMYLMIRMSWMF
jgi:ABC-type bacteriocin/lantibiotic exporter with double-glycine peptidase domain